MDDDSGSFEELSHSHKRLLASHAALQKLNESLEEKLLKNIEGYRLNIEELDNEVHELRKKCDELTLQNNNLIQKNIQLKSDCKLAVSLLRSSPENYRRSVHESEIPEDIKKRLPQDGENSNSISEEDGIKQDDSAATTTSANKGNPQNITSDESNLEKGIGQDKIVSVEVISDFLFRETIE